VADSLLAAAEVLRDDGYLYVTANRPPRAGFREGTRSGANRTDFSERASILGRCSCAEVSNSALGVRDFVSRTRFADAASSTALD
jgi:hypothetical protein